MSENDTDPTDATESIDPTTDPDSPGGADDASGENGRVNDSASEAERPADPPAEQDPPNEGRFGATAVRRYLTLGGVLVLALLALIAVFRLYNNVSAAVSLWVSPAYEPLFQAAFNLVVVLLTVSGAAALLGRLAE